MPIEQVRTIISESSGSHFDPDVVAAFLALEAELCAIRKGLAEPEQMKLAS